MILFERSAFVFWRLIITGMFIFRSSPIIWTSSNSWGSVTETLIFFESLAPSRDSNLLELLALSIFFFGISSLSDMFLKLKRDLLLFLSWYSSSGGSYEFSA